MTTNILLSLLITYLFIENNKPLAYRGEGLSFAVPPYLIVNKRNNNNHLYQVRLVHYNSSDTLGSINGARSVKAYLGIFPFWFAAPESIRLLR